MAPFAGYDMPIQYAGIAAEHEAVRRKVGVFDVSHMGEVEITGPDAAKFTNRLFTNDVGAVGSGGILYGMMLYPDGGTVDDLLVYRVADDDFFLVVNAANIEKDVAWIESHAKGFDVAVDNQSGRYGQIAVQGPEAERTMREVLGLDAAELAFYTFKKMEHGGETIIVSRTGYTGEDGFEVYASPDLVRQMWDKLVAAGVQPCGLGCRDTLRFEAGLPLYGDELSGEISPIAAALGMFVKLDKEGGFIGRDACARQKAEGTPRKLVGLELRDKAIPRHGYEVLDGEKVVGVVTTGYHALTLDKSVAFALVDREVAALGNVLSVRIRRKVFPATVVKKRFYAPNYKK
jgi:aminomethyltransferase